MTNRPYILIIDDDDLVRETICDMLTEEGHAVVVAGDGKSGIKAICDHRPRLVICDVRMPGMNGYEVLQEIRAQPEKYFEPSFVFLSGLNDKQFVKAGYKVGADDYITKPVDYDVLKLKVDAILRKRRREAPLARPSQPAQKTAENEVRNISVESGAASKVLFRPLWKPSRQMVVAFACRPIRGGAQAAGPAKPDLGGEVQGVEAVRIDRAMAAHAVGCLQGRQTAKDPIIVLPLHFATLNTQNREHLDALFNDVPKNRLSRRLAIEIIGVPRNRDEASIRHVVETALCFSSHISVQLPPDDIHAGLLKTIGAESLLLNLEQEWQAHPEKQVLIRLLDFVRRSKAQGFETTVYGLHSITAVRTAMEAGINLVGGQVIGKGQEAPGMVYELTRKYVLS